MKQWFFSRQPQERLALTVMAMFIMGAAIYTLFWLPLNDDIAQKRLWVSEQQKTLDWMQRTAIAIKRLNPSSKTGGQQKSNEALLTTIDRTAKQLNIRDAVKRIKPQGNDKVQLWLEQVPFDRVVRWLDSLQQQHNVSISTITIDRQSGSGLINARINLERS
ncbi:MAG: type II secretion system protein M [Candidatus Polarisedimenticolaceae bacterium]|nr:type II secretion system protein M [Candidatus Polarisedimenticolaceae bacterium]